MQSRWAPVRRDRVTSGPCLPFPLWCACHMPARRQIELKPDQGSDSLLLQNNNPSPGIGLFPTILRSLCQYNAITDAQTQDTNQRLRSYLAGRNFWVSQR